MTPAQQLISELERNHGVLRGQTDGLSHQDSLLQPAIRGNCMNWVLGHIVASRGGMVSALGMAPTWPTDAYAAYRRDSDPVTDVDQARPLESILEDLGRAQEQLLACLDGLDNAVLNAAFDKDEQTVGDRLSFLSWHETYHIGQTEYLRQLSGVDDKVI